VFAEVRDLVGKLLIANDTTPSWTAPERPVTRPWVVASTAFPPDNMSDLRVYLDAMWRWAWKKHSSIRCAMRIGSSMERPRFRGWPWPNSAIRLLLNFRQVVPVKAQVTNGNSAIRALAYRLGGSGAPGVIVAWTYQVDATVGRPKLWQPWLAPQPVRLEIAAPEVEISDLYGRGKRRVAVANGQVDMNIGEEPVYLRELPAAAQH